jgi:hypothetical protein
LYEAEVSGYSAVSSMLPLEWFTENNSEIAIRQGASDESRKDWIANASCCLQDRSFNKETNKQVMLFFPESERTGPPVGGRPHSPTRARAGARGASDDMTEDDETLQTASRVMA